MVSRKPFPAELREVHWRAYGMLLSVRGPSSARFRVKFIFRHAPIPVRPPEPQPRTRDAVRTRQHSYDITERHPPDRAEPMPSPAIRRQNRIAQDGAQCVTIQQTNDSLVWLGYVLITSGVPSYAGRAGQAF